MSDIIFDAEKHEYRAGGTKMPSVTKILAAVGMYKDLDKIPRHILDLAAERGKVVHEIIEFHGKGILDESSIDPALMGYYEAYLTCRADHPEIFGKLTDFEQMVFSEKFKYCGMYDAGGDGIIIDYKTTANTSPVHGLQLSAYWLADHPDYLNDKPEVLAGLYLKPDGTYNLCKYDYEPLQWISCLSVYNWQKKHGVI